MKYNRKSPRHPTYDYTSSGGYFVTIVTKNREHYFGEIKNGKMMVNALGAHTWKCRNQIPDHYPFVEIDEFICMPNHIHGILIIGDHKGNRDVGMDYHPSSGIKKQTNKKMHQREKKSKSSQNVTINNNEKIDPIDRTQNIASLPIGPKSGSLGSIIRGYKIGVTKFAHQNNIPCIRQSRYHDRIIRNNDEYNRIKRYIKNNPNNWNEDKFY